MKEKYFFKIGGSKRNYKGRWLVYNNLEKLYPCANCKLFYDNINDNFIIRIPSILDEHKTHEEYYIDGYIDCAKILDKEDFKILLENKNIDKNTINGTICTILKICDEYMNMVLEVSI